MIKEGVMNKLDPRACGLAFGILWAGCILLMGLAALAGSWAQPFVGLFSKLYVGYSASVAGILIGTVWGFLDAFIGGWVFAWLYNKLLK